jgi:hypothetical protein
MDVEEFSKIDPTEAKNKKLHPLQVAMIKDYHGDWDGAHQIAQKDTSDTGSWVHAYLHRKEGDESNARYWYSRAGKPFPEKSLNEEWEELVLHLLDY